MTRDLSILIEILKPYKYFVVLLVAVSFIASVFDGFSAGMLVPLLTSLQSQQEYDRLPRILQITTRLFSEYSTEKRILFSAASVVLAVLFKNVFWCISLYLGTWLSSKVMANLRFKGIEVLMSVGIEFYNKMKAGDLVERVLNNTERIENLVVHGTEFVANFACFAVLLTVLIIFSWRLTLITILFSVLIALAVSVYLRFLSNTGRKSANSSRELTSALYESINGIRVIKSYVKEHIQTLMLRDRVEKDRRIHHQLNFGNYLVHIITESLGVISIGIMFLLATIIYDIANKFLIAQLIPFIYILTRIIPTVKILNQARGSIASRLPFLKLLYDLLRVDDKPYIRDGCKSFVGLKGGIRFKSVTFSYRRNKTRALVNADYYIPKGKTTAIVGESGAGKSTVVNLLLRFYDPEEGVILIDEEPLETFNIESYRRKIGVVSQDTFIFNDTVRTNIAFGAAEKTTDELIIESARKAGAHEFIMELPEGYDTVLGDSGVRLSGGERQRISIARAILKNPDILILDEATSSLDSRTEKLIQNAICELSRNRTVIIIAHRLSTIKGADQIIVLKEGRIVEIGEEAQLIDKKGEYYKLSTAHP